MLPLLQLWIDPVPREGPENMAVDEWLAENATLPVLRSYRWAAGWGSYGYFVRNAELPPLPVRWVRRWTGGGIVDHRADWTYTLFIPRGYDLAEARGAESYRAIHSALAAALETAGQEARLAGISAPAAGGECFIQPVEHDVLDASGRKIAGAGQRRTVRGLLHQGSVAISRSCPGELAALLASRVEARDFSPDSPCLAGKVASRYANPAWTARR